MEKLVNQIRDNLVELGVDKPEFAVILGSGLANVLDDMEDKIYIPFKDIYGPCKK